jgi:hypothetical protein
MDNESSDGENGENGGAADLATFSKAISMLCDAQEKLISQNIKTPAAVKVKTDVISDIASIIEIIRMLRNMFCHEAVAGLGTIMEQMKELNASMKEVKEATKTKTTGSPWATTAPTPTSKPAIDPKALKVREQKTATRQERAKYEVTLTATTEETKKKIIGMSYKDITERIQTTIDTNVHHDEKPSIFGVSKPTKQGTVRVRCETEEQAKMLRHINWESGLEGLQARQPKFGIVIHAVNKAHFNILIDANKPTFDRIEKENTLSIVNIAPLRRKENKKPSEYHSIVIFTTDPHAADRCIKRGVYLDYRLYPAERYTPQLQVTQCYNCGKYGHRAACCKHKHHCGKCAEDLHATKDCQTNGEPKCSNCGGKHDNWHHECPTRITESCRLDSLWWQLSPYFTS